jgi:hypothetical protein
MMQCPQCGATITEAWRQCPYCDYLLETPQTGSQAEQQPGDEPIVVVESIDITPAIASIPTQKLENWFTAQRQQRPWRLIFGLAVAVVAAFIVMNFVLTDLLRVPSPIAVLHPATATAMPHLAISMTPQTPVMTQATATPIAPTPPATPPGTPALTVTFTCSTASGSHNRANICVQTSAGAQVTIAAVQCDGQPDSNLQPTTGIANPLGDFQWSWRMQDPGSCHQEHITVTAKISSGQTGQNSVNLPFT